MSCELVVAVDVDAVVVFEATQLVDVVAVLGKTLEQKFSIWMFLTYLKAF